MSIKGVIFDLDQTLVDSQSLDILRSQRPYQFQKIMDRIDEVIEYPGISDLLLDLHEKKVKIGIVTSNVSRYCDRIIQRNNWIIDDKVCYHDVIKHKPEPDPIFEILKRLQLLPKHVVCIGDDHNDIMASQKAGVFSIGATWGCKDPSKLAEVTPNKLCNSVAELRDFLLDSLE